MGRKLSAKGRKKMKQRIVVCVLFLIIIAAVVVAASAILIKLGGSSAEEPSADSSQPLSSEPADPSSVSSELPKEFAAVAASGAVDLTYFDDAVFVGDSITVGLGNYKILPAENVYADIGLNLDTIQTKQTVQTSSGSVTVLDALKLKKPSKVYIMLGSNGIAWIKPESLAKKYEAFLDQVIEALPDATIYVESILPVAASKEAADARYSNASINEYNQLLFNLAKEKGVYYLDCHASFKGADGALSTEYAEQDGMHLKKTGYEALLEFFKTHTAK